MADRMIVMNEGRVDQIGSPLEVYERPRTVFAAPRSKRQNNRLVAILAWLPPLFLIGRYTIVMRGLRKSCTDCHRAMAKIPHPHNTNAYSANHFAAWHNQSCPAPYPAQEFAPPETYPVNEAQNNPYRNQGPTLYGGFPQVLTRATYTRCGVAVPLLHRNWSRLD